MYDMKFIGKIAPVFILALHAFTILLLFVVSDLLFSAYNQTYEAPGFFSPRLFNGYFWLFMLITGILLIKNTSIKIIFICVILISILLQYFHYEYFGVLIQPISFYQMYFNSNEVITSFMDEANTMFVPLLIVILLSVSTLKIIKLNSQPDSTTDLLNSYSNSTIGLMIIGVIFFNGLYITYDNLHYHYEPGKLDHGQALIVLPIPGLHSTINVARSFNYFATGILPKKLLSSSVKQFESLPPPKIAEQHPNRNVVLVIGETLRAQSMSILGDTNNDTTPLLSEMDGIFASSIYASGTMTKTSVSALLNRLKYPGVTDQIASQKNCLFNLAKQNGFETHFLTAQTDSQEAILQNYICRKYIDQYETRSTFTKKNKDVSDYDLLLKQMMKNIDFINNDNFIVLQQRGSHSPYHMQYPKSFSRFESTYDNTVLFTDYVIHDIINYIGLQTNKPTYVIMTSDHGELLGEHGMKGHGWFYEEVYKVPFIFYAINTHNDLQHNLSNIQSHYGISNLVTSLLGFDVIVDIEEDVFVNGSDIDALSGYLHIKLDKSGNEISVNEIR